MANHHIKEMKAALILLILFTLLTGFIYPVFVTLIAQVFFSHQANGSLIEQNNKIVGSSLIGQTFDAANYFWSRPSATTPFPYHAANSSGSNLGPSNPDFLNTVKTRVAHIRQAHPDQTALVPVELVTASGSGLDPDISPNTAFYQVARVAKANQLSEQEIENLIKRLIKPRTMGLLGEPRVNVLKLNIALDELRKANVRTSS